ncbi:uncharacterized protein CELE_Y61A9LA.9 [Caenorhabditis elegans]|uniref:Uncharacterized protein n=1 Tax=Caenorhabditis elegans TaxID=6239 RepID=Q9N312_CAEEL|nr:Uncharacterized protein CELE_Y61A9LA.9 [Caenorhabditis elegans]CCD71771.1 Uncharacterized protein CELE_Y61A9LA.9 [Caenorhabditis elegans]|eukprot:NP_504242.1 Uncharacterized protein CELE_Y61A9LA.9 [Caenorhabditis elegans]
MSEPPPPHSAPVPMVKTDFFAFSGPYLPEDAHGTSSPPEKQQQTRKRGRPTALELLTTRVEELEKENSSLRTFRTAAESRCRALESKQSELFQTVEQLKVVVAKLTNECSARVTSNLPAPRLFADVLKGQSAEKKAEIIAERREAAASISLFEKKTHFAVIENLPDDGSDSQSAKDKVFLDNLIAANPSLPVHIQTFRVKTRKPVLSRPTKIRFSSEADRNSFIFSFSKTLRSLPDRPTNLPRPIRCRRDMTNDVIYPERVES